MKEEILQKTVMQYIDQLSLTKYKDKIFAFHVPNESMTNASIKWHSKRKSLGVKSGVSDIIILIKGGITLFVELKVDRLKNKRVDPDKLLSENQKSFFNVLQDLDFKYIVICAKTSTEAIERIDEILSKMVE